MKRKKQQSTSQVKDKLELFELQLTKKQLMHLRDLMSIYVPSTGEDDLATVSQHLAELENRQQTETKLWTKLVKVCKAAAVPTGDLVQDYAVSTPVPPPIGIFRVNIDRSQKRQQK